jgi:acyl-CoA thioesterase-1
MRRISLGYGASTHLHKAIALIVMIFLGVSSAAPVRAEALVVVAFGDSLTQGYGLPEADGFVPQLRDWLAAQAVEAQVINAGVSGDTTAGGAARIDWTLTDDVDGIVIALGGNDLLRGLDPAEARKNIERIVSAAAARGIAILLVGQAAPGNFGPEYKVDFDAIYPEVSAAYGTLYAPSFFEGLAPEGTPIDPAAVQPFMQGDGIHPNAEGVLRIVAALGPYVIDLIERVQTSKSLEKS